MAFSFRTTPMNKDHQRIDDIVNKKAPNDKTKQEALAKNQAKLITDPYKALRRARACLNIKEHDLAKIFLQKVIDLNKEDLLDKEDLATMSDLNFAYDMGLFF